MTENAETRRCRWCRRVFAVTPGRGRPRRYCAASCRQQDYVARRRAAELGVGERELVVARAEVDDLNDRLYVLEAAVDDVRRDLAEAGDDDGEVRRALAWLLDAAEQVVAPRRPLPPGRR